MALLISVIGPSPPGLGLSLTVHAGGLCPRGAGHLAGEAEALDSLGALFDVVPVAAAMSSNDLTGALLHQDWGGQTSQGPSPCPQPRSPPACLARSGALLPAKGRGVQEMASCQGGGGNGKSCSFCLPDPSLCPSDATLIPLWQSLALKKHGIPPPAPLPLAVSG